MSRTHNELSAVTITVQPLDGSGVPTTPTTASYRIDDCRSQRQLVPWTVLAPSSDITIIVPAPHDC